MGMAGVGSWSLGVARGEARADPVVSMTLTVRPLSTVEGWIGRPCRASLPGAAQKSHHGGRDGPIRGNPIVHQPIGDVVPALMPGIGSDASASGAATGRCN